MRLIEKQVQGLRCPATVWLSFTAIFHWINSEKEQ